MIKKVFTIPLDTEECRKVSAAMENYHSLSEIAREATVYRIIQYMLADKPLLERYLTGMAGLITAQRRQISHRELMLNVFNTGRHLSCFDKDFQAVFTNVVDWERQIQQRVFIAENHIQVDIHSNVWKIYKRHGDTLRLNSLDFSLVRCNSLRYELKYYFRYMFELSGKADAPLFHGHVLALNALSEINPQINYFADITESDARAMLLLPEKTYGKKSAAPLSQSTVVLAMNGVKRVIEYLMSDMRDSAIKTPRPYMNPFASIIFHNIGDYTTPTPVIPEDIVEQLNRHSEELSSTHKLLFDIFFNTGLRLKEVFFLETDCIEASRYEGIYQLKFKPYKVLAARRRHGAGDYHRVMIPQPLADSINRHIIETMPLRTANGSVFIFLSQKPGADKALMTSRPFFQSIRNIIAKHDIRDENGELWHLTSKQFRKTIAVTLIENGATTTELAYWLGHMSKCTAAKYYAEVRKMKLAELNTKFFKEKFDLILSGEQLEKYTEEERKLLYIDFRLEQRRVELGYCLIKAADGRCPNRNSLYNCVNCKNLCTGKKYLPYWNELLTQQKTIVEGLLLAYFSNGIENYADFAEYKQESRLLEGYESIVAAINEGGVAND
jgi:integrase